MEQTKKLNMTAMSDKTNSNTTAKKEEIGRASCRERV